LRQGAADAELLRGFVHAADESAFEALVRRHGPMVLAVCRRVLRNGADAEDCFQATFLVLARKANAIHNQQSLASWLYKVAYRIALRARANRAQRVARESQLRSEQNAISPDQGVRDLTYLVDEEVQRLPEKYRTPVLLCYLQGQTNEEAARQMRCPTGTVKVRLLRARELLRKRLTRRGLGLFLAGLLAAWSQPAQASLPPALQSATLEAGIQVGSGQTLAALGLSAGATCLAESWLKRLALAKIKLSCALLMLLALAVGTDHLIQKAWSAEPAAKKMPAAPETDPANSPGVRSLLISWLMDY